MTQDDSGHGHEYDPLLARQVEAMAGYGIPAESIALEGSGQRLGGCDPGRSPRIPTRAPSGAAEDSGEFPALEPEDEAF